MRARHLMFALGLLLAAGALAIGPSGVQAQDEFDDDFDDEFEDEGGGDDEAPPGDDLDDEGFDDEDEDGAQDGDEDAPPGDEELRGRRFRAANTLLGPTGGIRVVDAAPAASGSFRLQLATEFFFTSDFLEAGDENDHIGGYLSLSWAVHDLVELNASITSYANSNPLEDPSLFQVLGDTTLGAKVGYDVLPFLSIGGDLRLALLNTVGDIGLVLKSTSFGIRGNMTADLRGLPSPVPFVARLNLGYYLDNSSKLVEQVESDRYDALEDPRVLREEDRHLITRIERFALNINRTDFFQMGIGLEVPLRAAEDLYIHPMLEWTWGVPVNRQSYSCLFLPSEPGSDEPVDGSDGCLDRQGLDAFPMDLTLGVRVLPPVRGLSGFAAVDIGLTGTSTFVREIAANAPYNVMLGLAYAYDTTPPPDPEPVIQEVERRVEVRVPPPPKGRVAGLAVEQGAGTPIGGAIVRFPGQDLTALVSGDDGRFTTYQFDPGEITMELSHAEYETGGCAATVAAEGGDVEVRCELVALPRLGRVRGRVTGDGGMGISAEVVISGAATRTVRTDAAGNFTATDLTPGSYSARVDAGEAYLIKQQTFEVRAREETDVTIGLVPRPARPLVQIRRQQIQIRRQINFATDSAEILPTSFDLMAEIADVILRNADLTLIEIQGHTDNRGSADHNQDLSQRRAESVRQWLIEGGVEGTRLQARGYGMTQPLVPNITPANRARNRRVQFMIQSRAGAE